MGTVAPNRAGVAAAILNSARQSGAALGVAVFGGFISAQPFEAALRMALETATAISLVAALVWWTVSREPRNAQRQTHNACEQEVRKGKTSAPSRGVIAVRARETRCEP